MVERVKKGKCPLKRFFKILYHMQFLPNSIRVILEWSAGPLA